MSQNLISEHAEASDELSASELNLVAGGDCYMMKPPRDHTDTGGTTRSK